MRRKPIVRLVENAGSVLGLSLLLALTVNAQNSSAPGTEMDRVQAMFSQAKTGADQFSKSGGKPAKVRETDD